VLTVLLACLECSYGYAKASENNLAYSVHSFKLVILDSTEMDMGWVHPWVGLGWVGLGWVGLGWVGLGWVGLGWVGLGRIFQHM
jgi:hypothetical protein